MTENLLAARASIPLKDALAGAERIASRDRSSLYTVSQYFKDPARYHAFIAMYAVMRLVDDTVDNAGDKSKLSENQRRDLHAFLDEWEERIRGAYAGFGSDHPLEAALEWAVAKFPVPIELWLSFLDAMRFDVEVPRFENFDTFLEYAEGATVAPTTIYVYLMTALPQADGIYRVGDFDFESCGRSLGLFAYIAHILRDVRKDMHACEGGLVYISKADLQSHGLSEEALRMFVRASAGDKRFHALAATLVRRARKLQTDGTALAKAIWPALPADCRFVFQLIVRTYGLLLDRIATNPQRVLATDDILGWDDQVRLAHEVATETGYPKENLIGINHASKERICWNDVGWIMGGASVAALSISSLFDRPMLLTAIMGVLLLAFLKRWHARRDLVGLGVGAVLGNLAELLCDWAGVWRHVHPQILGVTPVYILLCYPILGVTIPRLIDAILSRVRPAGDAAENAHAFAALIFAIHVGLCVSFSGENLACSATSALCLLAFLCRFRTQHDRATLFIGGLIGLVWELPATLSGAWTFPNPQLFGLIPLWLPMAYAVFFGTLGRITAGLVACSENATARISKNAENPVPLLNAEVL